MRTIPDKQFLDTMSRDTSYWRGPFYFNTKDPRLLVPKLHPSMGWTLNFANPVSWGAVVALLGLVIIISFLA
jgi:uncharacterized membrane protein